VFRYVDDRHYYLFAVDETLGKARIFKRSSYSFEQLASANVAVNWDQKTLLAVTIDSYTFTGSVGGVAVVTAQDTAYPVGRIGLYHRALKDATFWGSLGIQHLTPSPGVWPRPWEL